MREKLKKLKKIVKDTFDEEREVKGSKKRKKQKEDTSEEEEFNEVTSVKGRRKKRVVKDDVKKKKVVESDDLDIKTDEVSGKDSQRDVKGKTRVKNVETCDVKKDANPVEDSVTSRRLKEISCWFAGMFCCDV